MSLPSQGWLGAAVAAAIMGDAAIAMRRQKEHLVFERIRRKRPAVAEDDGLSFARILVINFGTVLGCNEHVTSSFVRMIAGARPK